MAITFLVNSGSSGGIHGAITLPIDTTGASLLVAYTNSQESEIQVTDSRGNSWTKLTVSSNINTNLYGIIWYASNPSVGTGHTFTVSTTHFPDIHVVISVSAFSGVNTVSPFDQQLTNNDYNVLANITNLSTGSLTPSADNMLIITGVTTDNDNSSADFTIDASFSIIERHFLDSTLNCGAHAYKVQTSVASVNPTWTQTVKPVATFINNIACFKAATPVVLSAQIESASEIRSQFGGTVPFSAQIESQSSLSVYDLYFYQRIESQSKLSANLSVNSSVGFGIYTVSINETPPVAYLLSSPTNPTASLLADNSNVGYTSENPSSSPVFP